jgi:hypothetical protein
MYPVGWSQTLVTCGDPSKKESYYSIGSGEVDALPPRISMIRNILGGKCWLPPCTWSLFPVG